MVNWETQLHCSGDLGYGSTCSTLVKQAIKLFPTQKLWEILRATFSIGDMEVAQLNGGW